jgi:hypothetical protein
MYYSEYRKLESAVTCSYAMLASDHSPSATTIQNRGSSNGNGGGGNSNGGGGNGGGGGGGNGGGSGGNGGGSV